VAAGEATLDEVVAAWEGALDVSGLAAGQYELVATACYAGDCEEITDTVTL
jgi:hypothetical protein